MIECVIILALLTLLVATDPELGEFVSPSRPPRLAFNDRSTAGQTEN
jgi:hypothetical protein